MKVTFDLGELRQGRVLEGDPEIYRIEDEIKKMKGLNLCRK